jgi:hypothetical protein
MVKKIKNALTNLDQMLDPKTNNKIAILVVFFFSLANLDPRRFEQKP